MSRKKCPSERTPEEQMNAAVDLANEILAQHAAGEFEMDLCNACIVIVQTVCAKSDDLTLGEYMAGSISRAAQCLLKASVMRQVEVATAFPEGPQLH